MQSQFHAAFSAALTDADPGAVPSGFGTNEARRFAVYRNNVHLGLREALGAAYPVVRRLVGEAFFGALARAFTGQEQKRPASIALYGDGFADFIEQFEPAGSVPYLADVARLERAWLEAYHARDAAPLTAAMLAAHGDAIVEMPLKAHPAVRLISSEYPVLHIWRANSGRDPEDGQIELRNQAVLVTRPALDVQLTDVAPAAAPFVSALLAGKPVDEAYDPASGIDVVAVFQAVVAAGAFSSESGLGEVIDGHA